MGALHLVLVALLVAPDAVSADRSARFVTHGSRSRATIALTFDDGWGTANCRKVVDILKDTHTPATFLPNAKWVQREPDFWTEVARFGFPIANHTTHHPWLTRLPHAQQQREINSDRRIIEGITGVRMARVLRPPFGAFNTTTLRAAWDAGFHIVVNWDTTFADTSRRRDGRVRPLDRYLRTARKGGNGSIILGHCGSPVDHQILRELIARYRARGLEFVTVPQILNLRGATEMIFPEPAAARPWPQRAADWFAGPPGARRQPRICLTWGFTLNPAGSASHLAEAGPTGPLGGAHRPAASQARARA